VVVSALPVRNAARALGLAVLVVAPIATQHLMLRSQIVGNHRARAEADANTSAGFLEERVTRFFEGLRHGVSDLASREEIRRAALPRPGETEEDRMAARQKAGDVLADTMFALEAGARAWLLSGNQVLASSIPGSDEDPGFREELEGTRRGPRGNDFFDFTAPVRNRGLETEKPFVLLRVQARHLDALVQDVARAVGKDVRVVGLDGRGVCVVDTEGRYLAQAIEPLPLKTLEEWERTGALGEGTAALLRELGPAPRLTGVVRAEGSPILGRLRRVAAARIDLLYLAPDSGVEGELRSATTLAIVLSAVVGGAAFALVLTLRRADIASQRLPMTGPILAGAAVLVVSAGSTLYATRAIDERGRELRRSFALLVERSLQRDLESFVQTRLAFFSGLDDRLQMAADPRAEFHSQLVFARNVFREGRMALLSDSGLAPIGDALDYEGGAELPRGKQVLHQPLVLLEEVAPARDPRLAFEAPFRTKESAYRLIWAIPLSEVFSVVLTRERTSGFAVRVVAERSAPFAVYPRAAAGSADEVLGEPFPFPPSASAGGSSFHLALAPLPGVDLFGTETSRTIVLAFGMLLSVIAAGGTTFVLGALATHRRASRFDPLTATRNRLVFDEMLRRERQRALRYARPLSVAFVDLDHFKRVNDTLGHAAGDQVLQAAARELERAVRLTDFVFRHGGEEFAVLLPETDADAAIGVLERLRERFARSAFPGLEHVGPITVSAGVATLEPGETSDSILLRADEALYRAKQTGRNRVVAARKRASA
jgi:diguanylate cyclase (GGDEF)-like protein